MDFGLKSVSSSSHMSTRLASSANRLRRIRCGGDFCVDAKVATTGDGEGSFIGKSNEADTSNS